MDYLSPTAPDGPNGRRGSATTSRSQSPTLPLSATYVDSRHSNTGSVYSHEFVERASTSSFAREARDSTHLIPSISDSNTKGFHPLALRLPIAIGTPILMLALGIGLEIALFISKRDNGFAVPKENALSFASAQFLLAFVPTVLIIPVAFLWRELDWYVRQYQPYVLLSRGSATAEETLTNDYVSIGILGAIVNSLRFKHRVVFWSALTAAATYTLQPLAGSIFQVQQRAQPTSSTVTSVRSIGLASDIGELNAFVAAAGFVEAAVFNNLTDPSFIKGGWAIAEFIFPTQKYLNGTMVVNTTAIQTDPGCKPPDETPVLAAQQYGVEDASCSDAHNITFRPVMFWFFHKNEATDADEARTIFCRPTIKFFNIEATSSLDDGSLTDVEIKSDYTEPNSVTDALNDQVFNGLLFQSSDNPFIQARALAVQSGVPGAIFRNATQQPGGLQSVFDQSNSFLDLTTVAYRQHLSLSAKSIYFVSSANNLPAQMNSLLPRLVINPIPGHVLALIMFLIGCIGIFLHIIHRRQRKGLFLAAPPGTIAAIMSITSHSGFGQLLMPYDKEDTMRDKLSELRFRLDRRTGALVADDAPVSLKSMKQNRDEAMQALLGGHEKVNTSSKADIGDSSTRAAFEAASGYPPWQAQYKTPYDP
ncbi:hypothetical protein VNI00_011377 [Paramarasmius palmivorus]|uniref:Uncharacterized protein n=1 Tax=Paramarasmius palmivorus TaxID=297713 RepID=A0AAW0CB76_9AGAR